MHVLIVHGYLLAGTGSNVYNANLAAALARAGHEVTVVCQERHADELEWVDATGDWDEGRLRIRPRSGEVRVTVVRPDIGPVLPVYVADRYEGIEARTYLELGDEEIERYIGANVHALREVVERRRPDVALANHLVMSPAICARALSPLGIPYAVKIHGSALEYTVKADPDRFLPYASEGLRDARGILTGSRHTAESLWTALGDPELPGRTRLGPPGVDVERFEPRRPEDARRDLGRLRSSLRAAADRAARREADADPDAPVAPTSSFTRSPAEAADALERLPVEGDDPLVVFVGKLIGSKGVELLLAAWPIIIAAEPRARLVIVGFGNFRDGLRNFAGALERGDLDAAAELVAEDDRPLEHVRAWALGLDPAAREAYAAAARAMGERIVWTGRLEHEELTELLPAAAALVVPSTFPEAFGMVAAEAAACGALPVVAAHSGLAEVADALAAALPPQLAALLSFPLGPDAVDRLAGNIVGWLQAGAEDRARVREAIVAVTRERWSWDGVGRTAIAAARGRLAGLPAIPGQPAD